VKQKHILFLAPFYPDEGNPYAGRFFREHAEALAANGFNVSVIFPSVKAFSQEKTLRLSQTRESLHGVFTVRTARGVVSQRFAWMNNAALESACKSAFSAVVQEHGLPDFILAETGFPTGELAHRLSLNYGIPYGIFDHYSFSSRMLVEHRAGWPGVYSKAHFRAAVSPALQRVIRAGTDFRFPVEVLPNCLAGPLEDRPVLPLPDSKTMSWIFVGRDHPVKQPDLLFQAFAMLPQNHRLTTVGLPERYEAYKQLPDAVKSRITLLAGMPAGALWDEMDRHHALICTSAIETFGMAPLEMLALGRAITTTPCGGPEQFIRTENGRVSTGFSAEEVARAMLETETLVRSGWDGNSSAASVRQKYAASQFARTFASLLPS
jgi:glycosyltransferase involved in cell wall biosynthesis